MRTSNCSFRFSPSTWFLPITMCSSGGSFAAQSTQSAILLVCFLPAMFFPPFFLVLLLRLLRLLPVAVLFLLADRPLVVGCRAHPDPKLRLHLPRSPPGPLPSFRLISTVPVLRSLRMRLDSPFKTSSGSIASSWAIVALIVGWPINLVSRLSMIDLAASIARASIGRVFLGLRLLPSDRKSTRLNSSHSGESRMPSSA